MEATLYSFCRDVNSVPAPPQKPSLSPLGTTSSLSRSPPGLQTCSARQPLDQRPRCWDPGLSLSSSQNCLCSLQSAIPRIIVQDVWGRDQFRVFVKVPAGSWFWGMRMVENRPGCLESSCRTLGGEGVPGPPVSFLPELRVAKCYLHKEHLWKPKKMTCVTRKSHFWKKFTLNLPPSLSRQTAEVTVPRRLHAQHPLHSQRNWPRLLLKLATN